VQRLAIISRILLGLAFIPTGLVKLLGERFTVISVENPIGAVFEAMYQTGAYWHFPGFAQMLAGALLLVPRIVIGLASRVVRDDRGETWFYRRSESVRPVSSRLSARRRARAAAS